MFRTLLDVIKIFDQNVASYVTTTRSAFFDYFFYICTVLGNGKTIFVIACILAIVSFFIHRRKLLALFFAALAVGSAIIIFTKEFIARGRPAESVIPLPLSYSFPSGHALLAAICYGLLGYYIYTHTKKRSFKILGVLIMFVVPFLIGISRIYLGVHWTSDVIVGWLIGYVIVIGCVAIIRTHQKLLK